jgi:hypothetical protein
MRHEMTVCKTDIASLRQDTRWYPSFGPKHSRSLHGLVVSDSARRSSLANVVSGCVAFNCLMSFIIAESIPIFDDLLSVIGALLGSFLCM